MKQAISSRGFQFVQNKVYINGDETRLVSQSSATGDNAAPGSSYLWIGENHHLNRDEVKELVGYLENWLHTGNLW